MPVSVTYISAHEDCCRQNDRNYGIRQLSLGAVLFFTPLWKTEKTSHNYWWVLGGVVDAEESLCYINPVTLPHDAIDISPASAYLPHADAGDLILSVDINAEQDIHKGTQLTRNLRTVVSLVNRSATSGRALRNATASSLAEVTAFHVTLYSPA